MNAERKVIDSQLHMGGRMQGCRVADQGTCASVGDTLQIASGCLSCNRILFDGLRCIVASVTCCCLLACAQHPDACSHTGTAVR